MLEAPPSGKGQRITNWAHSCFPRWPFTRNPRSKPKNWHPRFVDYLFLSFNTSTALSPTDTQILSRWAKVLMMLQSLISLTIIVLLAARAVNIL